MKQSITDLPRNDLEACRKYYEQHGSRISFEEYRVMMDRQDDRADLEAMAKDWKVTDWMDDLLNIPL